MAVQAQYPSNVLLLNRDMQEGKLDNDYSLQPQPGGGGGGGGGSLVGGELFDHSHMLFNPGVGTSNPRKRAREMITTTTAGAGAGAATMNCNPLMSVALQQQRPRIIDLSQLHTPRNNVVSTGLRLAFGDQQQQNHHHHEQHQPSLSPQSSAQSSVLLSMLSDDLASHIKQQSEEIDNFIRVQEEQLRRALAEKKQRHYRALLGAAEEAVARRIREKEMEVEKAVRRNAELEARAAQLRAEAQAWQARARAQEATAATLQAQLQQAQLQQAMRSCGACNAHQAQDNGGDEWGNGAEARAVAEDAESAYVDPDRVAELTGPSCKACRKRVASVVLLPCRHLCLCTECDAVAQSCPLCFTFRSSSVEVILC